MCVVNKEMRRRYCNGRNHLIDIFCSTAALNRVPKHGLFPMRLQ